MEPLLHTSTRKQLESLIQAPRGAYVFYGSEGLGRFTTCLWLLSTWHGHFTFDSTCTRCVQIQAQTYQDLIIIKPEKDSIGIAQIQDLQRTLNLSRNDTHGQRMVIIDSASTLTPEAQNALLKALEEPPPDTVITLIASSPHALLATLRSRVQTVSFQALAEAQVKEYLIKQRQEGPTAIAQATQLAQGCPGQAILLLSSPDMLQQHLDTDLAAEQLLSSKLFEKLKLAANLAESKSLPTPLLINALLTRLRSQLRQDLKISNHDSAIRSTHKLQAIMRFQKHLKANVSPKTALGALALELT